MTSTEDLSIILRKYCEKHQIIDKNLHVLTNLQLQSPLPLNSDPACIDNILSVYHSTVNHVISKLTKDISNLETRVNDSEGTGKFMKSDDSFKSQKSGPRILQQQKARKLKSVVKNYQCLLSKSDMVIRRYFELIEIIRMIYARHFPLSIDMKKIIDEFHLVRIKLPDLLPCFAVKLKNSISRNEYALIQNDLKEILFPDLSFDYKVYGFNYSTKYCIGQSMRYLPNWDRDAVLSRIAVVKSKLESLKGDDRECLALKNELSTLNGLIRMFTLFSNQSRFGSLTTEIWATVEWMQSVCEKDYYVNLPDGIKKLDTFKSVEDTICWKYLMCIIDHYGGIPIYFKDDKTKIGTDKRVSLCLAQVLYALLNGIAHEMSGVLNNRCAKYYVKFLLFCAQESVSNVQLSLKSDVRALTKLLYDKPAKLLLSKYSNVGAFDSTSIEHFSGEFWSEGEKARLHELLVKSPSIIQDMYRYFDDLLNETSRKTLRDDCSVSDLVNHIELLRFMTIAFHTVTNPGIYHKTSLVIELEKSVGTVLKRNVPKPNIVSKVKIDNKLYPIVYNYNNSLTGILDDVKRIMSGLWKCKIKESISNVRDLEERFVFFLTNKSGGIKSLNAEELPPMLHDISNARIIHFALENDKFYNVDDFLQMVSANSKCAIRYQIDRRSRVIVIVPNAVQTAELFILLAFNAVKDGCSDIAVGKQVGNMLDALMQLAASGNINDLKNNGDMKGHDAHTIPRLTEFLRNTIAEYCIDVHVDDRYFCTTPYIGSLYNDLDQEVSSNVKISAITIHTAIVQEHNKSARYELPDHIFCNSVIAPKDTFASGLYGTSATHTMMLFLLNKVIDERMNMLTKRMNLNKVQIISSFLGDDIFQILKNGWLNRDAVNLWLKTVECVYNEVNYEQEVNVSRIFGTFLQQNCLAGVYVPSPARTSLFCDERSDTLQRSPIEIIKILSEVSNVYGQRTYCHDNMVGFMYSAWDAIRVKKYWYNDTKLGNVKEHVRKYMTVENDLAYLVLPILSISLAPINVPFPMIRLSSGSVVEGNEVTTTQGDASFIHLNMCFRKNDDGLDDDYYEFDIPFALHMNEFNRVRRLLDVRRQEIGLPAIDLMVKNLNYYLEPAKVLSASEARSKLLEFGIKVPDRLYYGNINREKIEQSLISKVETLDESLHIDKSYFNYINIFKIDNYAVNNKRLRVTNFKVKLSREREMSKSFLDMHVPILPTYHEYSAYGHVLAQTELPSGHLIGTSSSMNKITSTLGTSFDIQSAIDFGVKVFHINRNAMELVAKALGIPDKLISDYKALVERTSLESNYSDYSSIFNRVKYFAISGSNVYFKDRCKVYVNDRYIPILNNSNRYTRMIVRDLCFMYPKLFSKNDFYIVASKSLISKWLSKSNKGNM